MFETLTDRARSVISFAEAQAKRTNRAHVGTEHILLGLLREDSGIPATAMRNVGVDLNKARLEIEEVPDSDRIMGDPGHFQLMNRVLMYAVDEARTLGQVLVDSEHLLLGLLRDQGGVAAQIIIEQGVRLEAVREAVLSLIPGAPPTQAVAARDEAIVRAIDAVALAKDEAVRNAEYERAKELRDVEKQLQRIMRDAFGERR